MVPRMFTVAHDPASSIVTTCLEGHWTMAEFEDFASEMDKTVRAARERGKPLGLLSDSRAFPVQSQEVATAFAAANAVTQKAFAVSAIVVGSMLGKMQATRTMDAPDTKLFFDCDEARAWLTQELASRS